MRRLKSIPHFFKNTRNKTKTKSESRYLVSYNPKSRRRRREETQINSPFLQKHPKKTKPSQSLVTSTPTTQTRRRRREEAQTSSSDFKHPNQFPLDKPANSAT